jgi:hypothetical protein
MILLVEGDESGSGSWILAPSSLPAFVRFVIQNKEQKPQ